MPSSRQASALAALTAVSLAASSAAFTLPSTASLLRRPRPATRLSAAAARLSTGSVPTGVVDVCVLGGGPGGLSVAAECAALGLGVVVVDPSIDAKWPNNYGVWMDEVEHIGLADCVDAVWPKAQVNFDEDNTVMLQRPYGRVDRVALKDRLAARCKAGGAAFVGDAAVAVEHFPAAPSRVTLRDADAGIEALLVVDATGFARKVRARGQVRARAAAAPPPPTPPPLPSPPTPTPTPTPNPSHPPHTSSSSSSASSTPGTR